MAQIFDAPSKAILRSQIAEHIAETDKNEGGSCRPVKNRCRTTASSTAS
ncbi:polyphosphate kinase [Bifidobacterium dentium JCVIHMP022]|uniref:Polyphosphate kinase n=1 Tax=Bifidobacterium dentium JCVIHMP022 TaxID=553191 RepID=A0AB72Z0Y4_9BIFI|nr:polyphosphate kinase [Bifidobacterium dentium JCVIHMP022]